MSITLRRFSDEGILRFQEYLDALRLGESASFPSTLLANPAMTEELPGADIDAERKFGSRHEMGEYLVEAMKNLDQQAISHDTGLWSWLAFCFFDQLCPKDATGKRKPSMAYTYVLSRDYRHHARHAIRTTYYFVQRYGDKVRFMFSKLPSERGEIVEQLAARQELAASAGVIEAAHILYDDPVRQTFKSGAAGRGKGSIIRFVRVLQQFQLTYDLFSLTGSELVGLLPKEFDRFRQSPESTV